MIFNNYIYLSFINVYFWSFIREGNFSPYIRFKFRPFKRGNKFEVGLFRKAGLSLQNCVLECSRQPGCHGLRYFRRSTWCVLHDSTFGMTSFVPTNWTLSLPGGEVGEPCIEIARESIFIGDLQTECPCSENEICHQTENGTRCVLKGCPQITTVLHGKIHGNLYNVGSKIKFSCDDTYVVYKDDAVIKCLETGYWSQEPKCIFVCRDPVKGANVHLSVGNSTAGSKREFNCNQGHYFRNGTQYVASVTTECLQKEGDWSFNKISCVKGSKIGEKCSSTIPCVDTRAFCVDSTCFCHAMDIYDSHSLNCVPRCTESTNIFVTYTKTRFNGYNDWTVITNDVNECLNECITNPECFHVEDWTHLLNSLCYLGRVSYNTMSETKPSDIRHDTDKATIYSRWCT